MARICRTHYICLPCRGSWKKTRDSGREHHCPQCAGPLIDAGKALAVPPRRDVRGWRVLETLLRAGVRFHTDCDEHGLGYRPRTVHELRERLTHAKRSGEPRGEVLTRHSL